LKYRKLGKSDLTVSAIGLGTEQFGQREWGYGVAYHDEDILQVIRTALGSGITLFDTAELYGEGMSETLLGRAISDQRRDDFVIVSKVAPWNLKYESVVKAAHRSLVRLGLSFIDLYLVHYPNPLVSMRETFRAMEHLLKIGKIRHIGVSNFNAHLLEKAQESLSSSELVANEIEYNIFNRSAEVRTIPYCKRQGIGIIAYSPFAEGILTGRYQPDNPPKDRARAFNFYARKPFLRKAQPLFSVLREIAQERGATLTQVALGYVIRDPAVVTIPGVTSPDEVQDNIGAANVDLTCGEVKRINRTAPSLDVLRWTLDHRVYRPITWLKGGLQKGSLG
jgi:aryl-alcohol dehydrogenase-like predicted oxidoreductase